MQGRPRGETPPKILMPRRGLKARLQVRSVRRLPADSLGGQEEDLDRAREALWPSCGAGLPGRDLAAGEGWRRASRSISAPLGARRQHLRPR
ncbi:hypothetical protein NDU88_004203 [Pleurodeles waltl]|uniref:Uncharacterized protein n=1 Tax=Pleurodeles waltl TaxID=8319 RepID=A0AAV7N2D5_PLEWA|nr:hypothetical protein NDU88_004203 [Pleurodeles waltl]